MWKRIGMVAMTGVLGAMMVSGARAQVTQVASMPAASDSAHRGADSATVQPKKGGMFGKMKALAHNKTAQSIVKAAACTAIPGGSYMMSAIDAKQAKSVAGVAGNAAAGAASAAVGAGGGCIPGMGGMGMAAAMQRGITPRGGATTVSTGSVQMTNAQMLAMSGAQPSANGIAAPESEAPGQQMQMGSDYKSELAKGKLVIRKVDWMQHTNVPSASATQMLTDVMKSIGGAIKESGAKYRVDMYVSKDYDDAEAKQLAASRITTVLGMLGDGAAVGDAVVAGKAERNKDPRIEIVKVK